MKRSVEEAENGKAGVELSSASNKKARTDDFESDDDNLPLYAPSKLSSQKRQGKECPYLDTVSRQVRHCMKCCLPQCFLAVTPKEVCNPPQMAYFHQLIG